jgi:hypothetical protein
LPPSKIPAATTKQKQNLPLNVGSFCVFLATRFGASIEAFAGAGKAAGARRSTFSKALHTKHSYRTLIRCLQAAAAAAAAGDLSLPEDEKHEWAAEAARLQAEIM